MNLVLSIPRQASNTINFDIDYIDETFAIIVTNIDDENEEPEHIQSFDYQEVLAIRNLCNTFLKQFKP